MTIEATQPATNATTSVQLQSYMQALSLAEQIMSQTPAMPTEVDIVAAAWAPDSPEIRFYFHHNLDGLREFAAELRMEVSTEERENGQFYTEARLTAGNGVRLQAWTLSPRPVQEKGVGTEAPAVAA
ncbi:hypothetical protein L0F81_23690 [Streptomyces tricolor]|uniref:Uncharacterized protein n=1 Tax=Streptomyces tricolor TaxID=68277 RepID=A0ABS9JL50_9ACTN|nr:hypothetical protein [Streptomyces tricolor]MCG0066256.1 hypothetical protein [Streptomyces tricolor]